MQDRTNDRLLRAVTAEIQVDETLGEAMRERLMRTRPFTDDWSRGHVARVLGALPSPTP